MKVILIVLSLVIFGCQALPTRQLIVPDIPDLLVGGEVLSNLLLISGTKTMAPFADGFVDALESIVQQGKFSLSAIVQMIFALDLSPELEKLANKIEKDLHFVEDRLDDLERNARLGGELIKATAECVAPEYEAITRIKDETFRDLEDIIDYEKDAIKDLLAAGYSIEERITHLQDMEKQVMRAVVEGRMEDAVGQVMEHKQEAEMDAKTIRRIFNSAADDFNFVMGRAIEQLTETMQNVQVDGRKILRSVDKCLESKLSVGNK